MVLLTPKELERIKKTLHDFCKNEFVGRPIDNIGPYDFNLDNVKSMTDEEKKEFKEKFEKAIRELTKEDNDGNNKSN